MRGEGAPSYAGARGAPLQGPHFYPKIRLPPRGKVPPEGADEGRRPLLLTRAHEVRPYSILEQNPYRIFLATATP